MAKISRLGAGLLMLGGMGVLGVTGFGAAPIIEEIVPTSGLAKVVPSVPIGKVLLMPVTAYDDDGDPLSISVTSSNSKIMARVKTGNPLMTVKVKHLAGGTGDPAYEGTMVFQLFRDWTPITTGLISGFTSAGTVFNSQLFHRILDLNGGGAVEGYIYQGGFQGALPFTFENEFKAPLIFSGRGQLAMANADNRLDSRYPFYVGSNGAQFFITHGNVLQSGANAPGGPRHLDFRHTVFGQLTHGWEVLDSLNGTECFPGNDSTESQRNKPKVNVTLESASVSAQYDDGTHVYTDGVLVLSATGPGSSTITVTVKDGTGAMVSQNFTATAIVDDHNSPPFLVPPESATGPKETIFKVPTVKAVDLEFDYLSIDSVLRDTPVHGRSADNGSTILVLGNAGYEGRLNLGVAVTPFSMSYRGPIDGPLEQEADSLLKAIGVGDLPFKAEPTLIEAVTSTQISNGVVARFTDSDTRGGPGTMTATVNWGDGSDPEDGLVQSDPSRPVFNAGVVRAGHVYSQPGVYAVTVTINGNNGAQQIVRSTVVASLPESTLRAAGQEVEFRGKTVSNRLLATFTDSELADGDTYVATIDWGDGKVSPGVVKPIGAGKFGVSGTHAYVDPETFSLGVRIHKVGADVATDAYAWSRLILSGFSGQRHLPPFPQAHLVGQFSQIAIPKKNPNDPNEDQRFKSIRTVSGGVGSRQAFFTCQLSILNSGNVVSRPGKLRFVLSLDHKRLKGEAADPNDVALTVGAVQEMNLPAIRPGAVVQFFFDQIGGLDLRLRGPVGENGAGYSLLGVMNYSDPIANYEPIEIAAVTGPFNGIQVSPSSITTSEASTTGHTATFGVAIDRKPLVGKKYVLNVTSSLLTEGTVSPAQLTFTANNWQDPQIVTVTGVDDTVSDGNKNYKVVVSVDASTDDPHFYEMDPADVTVTNLDNDPKPTVSPTVVNTTEAAGTKHNGKFSVMFDQSPAPGKVVVVNLLSKDLARGTLSQSSLTFDSTNGMVAQEVTIFGVDNSIPNDDTTYKVEVTIDQSLTTDSHFLNADPPDVTVSHKDDEPRMIVSPTTLKTTEATGSTPVTFSVRFDQLPASDVTVTLENADATEGSIEPMSMSLTFTATNATTAQIVTVRGVDDFERDGDKTYAITVKPAVSTDPRFNTVKGATINVTNSDDE